MKLTNVRFALGRARKIAQVTKSVRVGMHLDETGSEYFLIAMCDSGTLKDCSMFL